MKINNFYKNKMNEEISKRIESREWDFKIAASVMDKRKNSIKKIFYSASISSLAAAAVIAFILSGVFNSKNEGLIYDEFITAQIKGTYDSALPVKNKNASKKVQINNKTDIIENSNQNNADIIAEDIDSLISDTLALR